MGATERADELAKLGISSDTILNCPIPHSYIKKQINNKVSLLNQKEWKRNGPKHIKMILGNKQAKMIRDLNTTLITEDTIEPHSTSLQDTAGSTTTFTR